ncbi:hypothetical protein GLN40_25350, partial [Shigella flexneri]|nr:hypothetical protein [Shigella flexneri]
YEERGEAGLRALKIGTKRNIAISVDPEKAASALELSKDRRIEVRCTGNSGHYHLFFF